MTYRKWNYMDILSISRMEEECFPNDKWSYQMFADAFSSDNFYGVCAEENGEIVGYACMTFGGDDADVCNIAVAENYRRNGIGGKLLEELIAEAKRRNTARIFLEVRVSNASAQILYLKHGFCGSYVRSRYYSDGEDAIVMVKLLSLRRPKKTV